MDDKASAPRKRSRYFVQKMKLREKSAEDHTEPENAPILSADSGTPTAVYEQESAYEPPSKNFVDLE